jgi:hypothetical protein
MLKGEEPQMHKYQSALEALTVGDALGMPTEFMTREYIKRNFGFVSSIIDPQFSLIHKNLARASITDDTEQNLYRSGTQKCRCLFRLSPPLISQRITIVSIRKSVLNIRLTLSMAQEIDL